MTQATVRRVRENDVARLQTECDGLAAQVRELQRIGSALRQLGTFAAWPGGLPEGVEDARRASQVFEVRKQEYLGAWDALSETLPPSTPSAA